MLPYRHVELKEHARVVTSHPHGLTALIHTVVSAAAVAVAVTMRPQIVFGPYFFPIARREHREKHHAS